MSYLCDGTEATYIAKYVKDFWEKMHMRDFRIEFNHHPFTIKFWLLDDKKEIARFTLTQQVNCCGILVSTDTLVSKEYQKLGIAQEMMSLKEALAKHFGYSCMMATVNITGNPAEVHILEKCGWTNVSQFVNSRTKNKVGIFTKNI